MSSIKADDKQKKSKKLSRSSEMAAKTSKASKEASKKKKAIPVTLLSGFLGAGKTTLLKNILEDDKHKLRIAVIVNDMAELNIDASLIKKAKVVQTKQEFITLQNGCICCTLRYDLIREIRRIYDIGEFDYIVIESTGIAEPMNVAENFTVNPDTGLSHDDDALALQSYARLDTCVTVVDASEFLNHFQSLNTAAQDFSISADESEGTKNVSRLLTDQIEFANVIILNKCDLIPESVNLEGEIVPFIEKMNPKATLIRTSRCHVDFRHILNTGLFSMQEASTAAGWLKSLKDDKVVSEKDEYGIFSFVYRSRKPFHPGRLHSFLTEMFVLEDTWAKLCDSNQTTTTSPNLNSRHGLILRSKGFCWVSTRDDTMIEWNHHGKRLQLNAVMQWYALTPMSAWNVSDDEAGIIKNDFVGQYGDRRQEIVFIGINMQKDHICNALDSCLLTNDELADFVAYPQARIQKPTATIHGTVDPLPAWPIEISYPQTFSCIVRGQESKIILVSPGIELTLQNISLNLTSDQYGSSENASSIIVKVWAEYVDASTSMKSAILLCTLHPGTHDQYSTQFSIMSAPTEELNQGDEDDNGGCAIDDADQNEDSPQPQQHDGHDHDEESRQPLLIRLSMEVLYARKRRSSVSSNDTDQVEAHIAGRAKWQTSN